MEDIAGWIETVHRLYFAHVWFSPFWFAFNQPFYFEKVSNLPFTFLRSFSSSTIASAFLLVAVFFAGMTATLEDFGIKKQTNTKTTNF